MFCLFDVYVFKTVHYNWTPCVYHTEYFKSWCPCTQSLADAPAKIPVILSHSWLLEGPLQSWRCTLDWLVRDFLQRKWFQRETNRRPLPLIRHAAKSGPIAYNQHTNKRCYLFEVSIPTFYQQQRQILWPGKHDPRGKNHPTYQLFDPQNLEIHEGL